MEQTEKTKKGKTSDEIIEEIEALLMSYEMTYRAAKKILEHVLVRLRRRVQEVQIRSLIKKVPSKKLDEDI